MFLVKHGVPFDVAFGCDDDFRMAAVVVMAKFEGQEFDWTTLTFSERTP